MMKLRIFGRSKADTCDSLWPLLSAYADGEASESESARVEAHVSVCTPCASALSLIQNTSVSLASIEEVEPPRYLHGAILAATTALDVSTAKTKLARRPMRLQWGFGAAALAGVLAALIFHSNQGKIDVPQVSPSPPRELTQNQPSAPPPSSENLPAEPRRAIARDESANSQIETAAAAPDENDGRRDLRSAELGSPTPSVPNGLTAIEIPRKSGVTVKVATAGPKPSSKPKVDAPMTVAENAPMAPMDMMPEASAPKIDMAVMSTPMPMDMAPMGGVEATPPAAAEPMARKIVLTAEPKALPLGQVASLADLKKSLRQQSIQWNRPDAMRGLTSKQISVEIVKRSF